MTSVTLHEQNILVSSFTRSNDPIGQLSKSVWDELPDHQQPIRVAITDQANRVQTCEVGVMDADWQKMRIPNIFEFRPRRMENSDTFNCVLVVPTGIGAEIGGHAGDASPVARLFAQVCDTVVTHPNVVNASDMVHIPDNCLYVEGSALARVMQGTMGLSRSRGNRLLVVIGPHEDDLFRNAAINAVNAARAVYGLREPTVVMIEDGPFMETTYSPSGRATGRVDGVPALFSVLDERLEGHDAVAVASRIKVPPGTYDQYFNETGEVVNPWGGVEALLTHAITARYGVPAAHAPMIESVEITNEDPGVVDPRIAAEAVSFALIQCVLRGLQYSPRLVTDRYDLGAYSLTARDISCLVIPDGCVGLPTLAALQQGITTIAVRENRNLMQNDLTVLPWRPGQLLFAENYWEAAGIMVALRAGLDPTAVRRPLLPAPVVRHKAASLNHAPVE